MSLRNLTISFLTLFCISHPQTGLAQTCFPYDLMSAPSYGIVSGLEIGSPAFGGISYYSASGVVYAHSPGTPSSALLNGWLLGIHDEVTQGRTAVVVADRQYIRSTFKDRVRAFYHSGGATSQPFTINDNPVNNSTALWVNRASVSQGILSWTQTRQDIPTNTFHSELHGCVLEGNSSGPLKSCALGARTLIATRISNAAGVPGSQFVYAVGYSHQGQHGIIAHEMTNANANSQIRRFNSGGMTTIRTVAAASVLPPSPGTYLQGMVLPTSIGYVDVDTNFSTTLVTQGLTSGALMTHATEVSLGYNNVRTDITIDPLATQLSYVYRRNGYIAKFVNSGGAIEIVPGLLTVTSLASMNGPMVSQLLEYNQQRYILTSVCY